MTDDKDDLIRQLAQRLQETVDENDQLRAELVRMTEGASAYTTLSDIHRNRDLPAAVRTKAAIGCLSREIPPLAPERAPIELTAEPVRPLSEIVQEQRARADAWLALPLAEREALITGVVRSDGNSGNGQDDSSSNDD